MVSDIERQDPCDFLKEFRKMKVGEAIATTLPSEFRVADTRRKFRFVQPKS